MSGSRMMDSKSEKFRTELEVKLLIYISSDKRIIADKDGIMLQNWYDSDEDYLTVQRFTWTEWEYIKKRLEEFREKVMKND